jgi:hypothetical protein
MDGICIGEPEHINITKVADRLSRRAESGLCDDLTAVNHELQNYTNSNSITPKEYAMLLDAMHADNITDRSRNFHLPELEFYASTRGGPIDSVGAIYSEGPDKGSAHHGGTEFPSTAAPHLEAPRSVAPALPITLTR